MAKFKRSNSDQIGLNDSLSKTDSGDKKIVNSTELFVSSYESFMKKHLFGFEIRGGRLRRTSSCEELSSCGDLMDSIATTRNKQGSTASCHDGRGNSIVQSGKSVNSRHTFKERQRSEDLKEKLCEPRALYAEWSQPGPQHLPRWPIEMIVIEERIKHRYFPCTERQPFLHNAAGLDATPVPVISRNSGRLVYHYKPSGSSSFVRSCVGGSRDGKCFTRVDPKHQDDTLLVFESRFESANLEKVVQISKYNYELYLRNDLYNWKQAQWFYFRVSNTRSGPSYRLSIVNLSKQGSLYRNGMQPLLYSTKMARDDAVGWRRDGFDILYCRNQFVQEDNVPSYTLSFSVNFPYDNDDVYFAHCYPYTYSDLQDYLLSMQQKESLSKICRQRILCWSLAGNLVPLVTITSPETERKETSQVFLYCDVHGHSRKPSVFLYGCENGSTSNSHLHEWIFPYLFQKASMDKFSLENCSSKVQRCRIGTGRITMWKMGIQNSYTLEASMGGVLSGSKIEHLMFSDYETCGRNFCEALYEYHCASATKIAQLLGTIKELIQEKVIGDLDEMENGTGSDCEFDLVDLSTNLSKVSTKSIGKRKSRKDPRATSKSATDRKNKSCTR